ncbi:MAG: ankyrin repeat domain-containing protein [Rickettsiales bacterium]|jgi:ankyrin repeat protein|nr:ankyrin repeat domain-containing protein [Rickettsiales bacterium]
MSDVVDPKGVCVIGQDSWTALMRASNNGDEEVVRLLCSRGKGLRKQDAKGDTALILATKKGHAGCVAILVKFEGGMRNNEGKSALDYAIENEDEVCIKILQDSESGKLEEEYESGELEEEYENLKNATKDVNKYVEKGRAQFI